MSKFYVQCGPVRTILTAESAEQAALAALDPTLQVHVWIYDDPGLSTQDCRDHMMLEALFHLDPAIRVSEQGFDRDDALLVGTPEIVDRWHRLMVGMSRLFVAAGLRPRSIAELATSTSAAVMTRPRRPR
jgi:hypothetical protein